MYIKTTCETTWVVLGSNKMFLPHPRLLYYLSNLLSSGVYGQKTTDFLKELGHRLRQVSGEANSFQYLAQRLSVAIQRGNSASVMGTTNGDDEEFFV